MKILVTGGAGYIGSVLVPMLLQKGYKVTVLDNFMYGQTSLLDCCYDRNLEIIRGDVRDRDLIKKLISQCDVILPLACLTGAPLCDRDPVGAKQINYDAVRFIAECKSPEQMLIFPCTNSGYGVGEEGIFCDENTPMRPVSLYGRLKVDLDRYLLDRRDCVTFRFATVFGISPRMRLDLLVNDFTYRAVVDRTVVLFEAHFKRNYLHVRDAAGAFIHAIKNYSTMKGKPFNVGLSEANLSKQELCEVIQCHVREFRFILSEIGKDPDRRNYIVSNERMEATGFKTQVSLDRGIQELVKGYQIIRRNQFSNL
ncbi:MULTISPECIES: NAD(P)-dependent oxidoreductase [Spirulina sp. CCY15215]|uniref:NAD-dependent epimerase/dehydratase family protein n=1 Tax=Spirulina sp. CCY15215 TaxID=2767591 RepID=UPI00194F30EC|nr:NAD(P)-dependent oxidoreductase [Spirulina major]